MEASQPLPSTTPDGEAWPLISIVTPSFNRGRFLEMTVRSVLFRAYPNLEYLIFDAGSADERVNILRNYGHCMDCWVSAPDNCESDAIYRGWELSNGEVLAWLNSHGAY